MKLKYDLEATGTANVRRAMNTIERDWDRHVSSMNRKAGVRPGQAGVNTNPAGEAMKTRRLQEGVQRFLHRQALGQIKAEERQRLASERAVAREKLEGERRATRERISGEKKAERERLASVRRDHRQAMASRRARERFTRRAVGFAGNSVRNTLSTAGGAAVTTLGLGGAIVATEAVRKTARAEKSAAQLANIAYGVDGDKRSRKQIFNEIMNQSRAEGIRTGLGTEATIDMLKQYQAKSGLVTEGQALLPFLGDISDAYGADPTDVARSAGQISQSLSVNRGIRGTKNVEMTKQVLSNVAGQSKIGSIDFPEYASVMGSLISSMARFEGDFTDLVSTMSAFGQMALAGGADSPRESMTALKRMSDDMVKHSDRFAAIGGGGKNGVDVYANKEKTALRNPAEVFFEVLKKTGGNLETAQGLFNVRSMKAFEPVQQQFVKAGGGKKGF